MDYWLTVSAAGLGGIVAGLLLQWNQQRLHRATERRKYEKIRAALVTDLVHNFGVFLQLFEDAQEPYHQIDPGPNGENVRWMLGDAPAKANGGKPHAIHLETWALARPHIVGLTDNPGDVIRFGRAFQAVRDSITGDSSDTFDRDAQFFWRDKDTIFQPAVFTSEGLQLHGVPMSLFRVLWASDVLAEVASLVTEFGTEDQVAWAGKIEGLPANEGGWTGVEDKTMIPTRFSPGRTP